MQIQELALHIAERLPENTTNAEILSTCGYMASVILGGVPDPALRNEALEKFIVALRATAVPVPFSSRGMN